MNFTAKDVSELREKTGAGMMDCKKALTEADGNMEAAVDFLRTKGLATAAKKSSRIAAEGTIADTMSSDGNTHVLVEVNCETDFVTKTPEFKDLSKNVADLVLTKKPNDVDALLNLEVGGKKINDIQTEIVAKIGENIKVRRFVTMQRSGTEKIAKYIHSGSKIISLVKFDDPNNKLDDQTAREYAMHVAAMNPAYVAKENVPEDFIVREKAIAMEQMADEKKPPEIMEKILLGKINKQLSEICLEDQIYVKDPDGKNSVKNSLKKVDPNIRIKEFIRLQVGEGIEKRKCDLAAEVAEMVK